MASYRAWEWHRLQNKFLRITGNFPRCTPARDLHRAFNHLYIFDYIKNCAGNKQKSYKTMRMNMFAAQGKAKLDLENIRRSLNMRQPTLQQRGRNDKVPRRDDTSQNKLRTIAYSREP
jgi:hypothetical protein